MAPKYRFGSRALHGKEMSTEFTDKSKHQPESALAGISESILNGLTTPIELFTPSENKQKTAKDLSDFRESARDYLKEGLKTAAMFMRGKTGLVGTIATQALDEWKPQDTKHQFLDLGLGATKGAALTYVFRKTAMVDAAIKYTPSICKVPLQSAVFGLLSRVPTVGLSRSTWVDENDKFNAQRTGNILLASTTSIGTDIIAGIVTHGLLKGVNHATGDAVANSPMLSTILTGTGYGMSNGAAMEIARQQEKQEHFDLRNFDYAKVAQSALLQGAIDSVAAIPGGHQAEREALSRYNNMVAGEKVTKVPSFKKAKNQSEVSTAPHVSESKRGIDRCSMCLDTKQAKETTITPVPEVSTAEKFNRFSKQYSSRRLKDFYDPETNDVLTKPHSFTVYLSKQHNLSIAVPTEFNKNLKLVRELRIRTENRERNGNQFDLRDLQLAMKADKHLTKALPEDLLPHFDALPNSTLIKKVYLLDEISPWDIKFPNDYFGPAAAEAKPGGEILYYKSPNDSKFLRLLTNHEFGHMVHLKFPEASEAYLAACTLENALVDPKLLRNAREYSTKDEFENFAVHFGEELLDPSPERFLRAVEYAPIRMAVLAKALKSVLTEIPQAEISLYRDQFLARAELLEKTLVPQIVDRMFKELSTSEVLDGGQLDVVRYLGSPRDVNKILALAKRVVHQREATALVDTGLKLLKHDRKKQVDFLLKFSENSTNQLVREQSISELTKTEVEHHLVDKLGSILNKGDMSFVRRLNDISFWFQQQFQFSKAEQFARSALTFNDLYKSRNSETVWSLQLLSDQLMYQQKYKEAERFMRDAVNISRKLNGEQHSVTRQCLDTLVDHLFLECRYAEALPYMIRRLQIHRVTDPEAIAYDLADLSLCFDSLGMQKGYDFCQNLLSQLHPDSAHAI